MPDAAFLLALQQAAVAREMRVQPRLLHTLLELPSSERPDNVLSLAESTKLYR